MNERYRLVSIGIVVVCAKQAALFSDSGIGCLHLGKTLAAYPLGVCPMNERYRLVSIGIVACAKLAALFSDSRIGSLLLGKTFAACPPSDCFQ